MRKITILFFLLTISIGYSQNLALSGTTDSSSGSSALAVDGNMGTRWESAFTDTEWWSVDLGASYDIGQVIIYWEGAYGDQYTIDISSDNTNWTTIYTEAAGDGGTDDLLVSGTGRYIRYNGTHRALPYGHSFWEFEVYGAVLPTADATLSDLTVDGTTVTGFSAGTFSYDIELPNGTTTVPTVIGTPTQASPAVAATTDTGSLPGTSTVLVTAQDGVTTQTYTLNFSLAPGATPESPTPTNDSADVISVYSDTYSNIYTGLNPNWGQSTTMTEVQISGNNTLKYENLNYQGLEYANTNVSGMEYVHLDYYTNDATDLSFYLISPGAENAYDINAEVGIVTGSWQSIDIPISHFTVPDLANVFQFKTVGNGTVYLDNLYFWKTPPAPGSNATLSDLQIEGVTVDGFSSSATEYIYELTIGTTVVPQITSVTTTDPAVTSTTITQASSIPGDATVVVVSQNGSVSETYTVSFTATLPNPSPTPSTPAGEVLSIYGDTGGFSNTWSPDYSFGSFVDKPDLDTSASTNESIKMDFSVAGYGEGTNTQSDISTYNWVHFDYFVPNLPAGVSGHQVRFILIGGGEFNYEMTLGGSDGTLVLGSWQSVDVQLSVFEGKGFSKTNYLQFKIGSESDLNTSIVYFDNIYFSVNQGTVQANLGVNDYEIEGLNTYPNPTSNRWVISTFNEDITSIEVFNLLGKNVISLKPNATEVQIDASELASGIYISKISTASGTSSRKLIKK